MRSVWCCSVRMSISRLYASPSQFYLCIYAFGRSFDFSSVCHRLNSVLAHCQQTFIWATVCVCRGERRWRLRINCIVPCLEKSVPAVMLMCWKWNLPGNVPDETARSIEMRNENIPALGSLTRPDVLVRHVSTPHGPAGDERPNFVHLEALV